MEKLNTGGTAPDLNKEDACRIVPSPPSVITKSIFSDSGPGVGYVKQAATGDRAGTTDQVTKY